MSQATGVEQNKRLASRAITEIISEGNFDVIDEILAEDFAQYGGVSGDLQGTDALEEWMEQVYAGFSEFEATEEFSLCEDDLVAVRVTYSGTHDGEFMGIPATDEYVEITGTTIFRVEDGRIVEGWVETDTIGILQQVGAMDSSTA